MNLTFKSTPARGGEYLKITILGLGLAALSQSLHGIILPLRVLDFAGEAGKNTALAGLTFAGLLLAMLSQPIAAAFSDATTSRWGRRKPYVIVGIAAVLVLLPGIGLASSFAALFAVYLMIQLAANIAQGPYQGYLPELVPLDHRGRVSSLKSQMEVIGGATGVLATGWLLSGYSSDNDRGLWLSIGVLALIIGGIGLLLWRRLKEPPAIAAAAPLRNPLLAYRFNLRENRPFAWLLVSRLLFFMASATLQQFALFYLRDVLGVADPAGATAAFTLTAIASMALAIFPAGFFADRYGKARLSQAAALLGGAGIFILLMWPSPTTMLIAAGVTGFALGTFSVSNWAMATEMVVKGQEARYLAIANMATAGGAAAARFIGPVIDHFNRVEVNLGYQVMLFACVVYFVLGGLLITRANRPAS